MPHLYLTADDALRRSVEKLPVYLELSGINFHSDLPAQPPAEAARLVLRSVAGGAGVTVQHTPSVASARLAFCLSSALRQLPAMEAQLHVRSAAPAGALHPAGMPAVMIAFSGANAEGLLAGIAQDAVLRALSHAMAAYFRLPELPMRLEQPAILCSATDTLLRHYPHAAALSLASVPAGSQLSVLGQVADWLLVRHGQSVGFLPRGRVTPI